jgi:hypothetical protein
MLPSDLRQHWLNKRLNDIPLTDDFNIYLSTNKRFILIESLIEINALCYRLGWSIGEMDQLTRLMIEVAYQRCLK